MSKRYYLFGGDQYYPCGGMADFVESFDVLDDAIAMGRKKYGEILEWFHVLDTEVFGIVCAEGTGNSLQLAGDELKLAVAKA